MRLYDDADPVRRLRGRLKAITEHTHVHSALTGLDADDHTQYHTNARALTWLGTRTADDLPEGSTHLYLTEAEREILASIDEEYAPASHTHSADDIVGGTLDGGSA